MGVAVDHQVDAVAGEGVHDRGRRDVGDGLERGAVVVLHRLLAAVAGLPRLRGEGQARRQRLGEELRLPARVAGLGAELLVGGVVAA